MRVVAAMSGGVDSAVSAARMLDAGHEVLLTADLGSAFMSAEIVVELEHRPADGRTVVATPAGYADEVAHGSGLGGSDAFKDAVPEADDARLRAAVRTALAGLGGEG